ncbi:hypothetical protein [Georgenia sp. H159]|uniref:hypothetical protein n=1 Tax=Georgenia sp. H159 TaxID=3076115 RepID=UPI002D79C384|nr:hypothetical protein [Georgenia sp. H159]
MARTTKQVDARERARKARLRVDAEREQRDRKIEDAAADYFTAAANYAEVAEKLEEVEERMRTAVKSLLDWVSPRPASPRYWRSAPRRSAGYAPAWTRAPRPPLKRATFIREPTTNRRSEVSQVRRCEGSASGTAHR